MVLALFLTACDDWLTVEPKDMVTVDKALSEREGYEAALTGVYQLLQSTYNPGGFMMAGGVDGLANTYYEPTYRFSPALNSCYNYSFDDTNFDNASGAIFLSFYKALANINVLAQNIEDQDVLSDQEYALIKGEVKALRALLQFDLWRLYGPAPGNEVGGELVLPYATDASPELLPYSDYQAYFDQLLEDLADARELMSGSDPILQYSNALLNASGSIDEYDNISWYYRQNRMNYYAVLGLSARVALWMGNTDQAYEFAKQVVDAKNEDGSSKFTLGGAANIAEGDYAFFTEHLFGVSTNDYDDNSYSTYDASCVTQSWELNNYVFTPNTSDIRRLSLFTSLDNNAVAGSGAFASLKYSNMSETDPGAKNFPVIRLSEMYLILAETDPNLTEAKEYFATYLNSRYAESNELPDTNRQEVVLTQYIREFWAEGQIFFTYKRINLSSLPISYRTVSPENYKIPLPTGETISNL